MTIFIYSPVLTQVMNSRAGKFNLHLGCAPKSPVPVESPSLWTYQWGPRAQLSSAPFWLLPPGLLLSSRLCLCWEGRLHALSDQGQCFLLDFFKYLRFPFN